jgi:hypothetical protein
MLSGIDMNEADFTLIYFKSSQESHVSRLLNF